MRVHIDNDVPCPNCQRIDGAPETAHYYDHGDHIIQARSVSVFACSHCVHALQKALDKLYPPRKVGAR